MPKAGAWLLGWIALCAILSVGALALRSLGGALQQPLPTVMLGPTMPAPDFHLVAVRGGEQQLSSLKGSPVLLSFVNTAESPGDQAQSRGQIAFFRSMAQQYGPKGVHVLLIDAASLQTGRPTPTDDLLNFSYDWQLDAVPVLQDTGRETARAYTVSLAPTTFLIRPDGTIAERWNGFAAVSQLALALQALVEPPAADQTALVPPTCAETPTQARFAGLPLARSLGQAIWLVDGGATWQHDSAVPAHLLVLDKHADHIQVMATDLQSSKTTIVLDAALAPLPSDQASALTNGQNMAISAVTTPIKLPWRGCVQLQVTVSAQSTPIGSGQATMFVR